MIVCINCHQPKKLSEMGKRKDRAHDPRCKAYISESVYYGSHQTYTLCRQAIESLYTDKYREKIASDLGEKPTRKQCLKLIDRLELGKAGNVHSVRSDAANFFAAYSDHSNPLDALAAAITDVTFRILSGDPTDFYRGIGVRVGFLRPTGGTRKYFTLDGTLLEAVLASIVGDEEISFKDLLNNLHCRYGVLTGGRPEDAELLLEAGIDQVTIEDLRENATTLRQELVAMGWARAFADGVMTVRTPHGGTR